MLDASRQPLMMASNGHAAGLAILNFPWSRVLPWQASSGQPRAGVRTCNLIVCSQLGIDLSSILSSTRLNVSVQWLLRMIEAIRVQEIMSQLKQSLVSSSDLSSP
jgi:hypothetical protein